MKLSLSLIAALLLTGCAASTPPAELSACVNEDGSGQALPCVWDATVQGNGQGLSFTINSDGTVTYK